MSTGQKAESFPGRNFYKGRGVDWSRFLPWLLLAVVVTMALAEGMAQLFRAGHYYIFIVPLIAALCVAGMMSVAVSRGHCRSPIVGGIGGFIAGLLLYLGYFYFGMILDFGPEAARNPEFLPKYIRLRMATEVTHDVNEPRNGEKARAPSHGGVYVNWGRTTFEFGLILFITIGTALKRTRKPYCEICHRWMIREITPFEPVHSAELLDALRTHSAHSLAALCAKAPFTTIPNVSLAIDFCPTLNHGIYRDCAVFVSVKNINFPPKALVRDPFEQSKGKMLLDKMQMERDELAALAQRFAPFEAVAGRTAVGMLLPKEAFDEAAGNNLVYAEITPLPEEHAGKILTRKTVLIASALSFFILLGFFAGVGLLFWGWITAFPDSPPPDGVSPRAKALGITLMSSGGIWLCFSLTVMLIDSSFFFNHYIRRQLSREFSRRTSMLVDLNDPEALFVERVPKTNWGKMMLDNAGDIGLLVVDRSRREIRFEGDKERWRIPTAAISSCQFEEFVQRQGDAKTRIFYVVLQANYRDGFWEAPIRPRGNLGFFSGKRKKATRELFEAIENIRNTS